MRKTPVQKTPSALRPTLPVVDAIKSLFFRETLTTPSGQLFMPSALPATVLSTSRQPAPSPDEPILKTARTCPVCTGF